jgi:hypothetical protein
MLLARRNEGLESLLQSYVEDLRKQNGVPTTKGKGKGKGKGARK